MQRKTIMNSGNRQTEDEQLECSCQILYDTSLSSVSSVSCDCSECLEANLNAFNQCKQAEEENDKNRANKKNKNFGNKNRTGSLTRNQTIKNKKQPNGNEKTQPKIDRYKSTNKIGKKTHTHFKYSDNYESEDQANIEKDQVPYNNEQLNDFLYVTKYRTRKYLEERKKLQLNEKLKKNQLKQNIKKNLQILKMTARMMMTEDEKKREEQRDILQHPYKWNHSKYKCECNQKKVVCKDGKQKQEKSHECCRKIKVKSQLDTNMDKIHGDFKQNRDIILQALKKQRLQSQKPAQENCPYDKCPNHHNRTSEQKIAQMRKFIIKQSQKYQKKMKKAKQSQQEAQKVKQAKLRAIDIKSRQILSKSKKYDGNASRTSFKLSIDNFDTFSQLREENQRIKQIKKNQRKVKEQLKTGGVQLQQKIYEDIGEQEDEFENYINQAKSKSKQVRTLKKQDYVPQNDNNYQNKILYDAKIKDPTQSLKKIAKPIKGRQTKKQKNRQLSRTKQDQHRKQLQKEIEKKKKQILNEYTKRNTNKESDKSSKNKKLRQEYANKKKQETNSKTQYKGNIFKTEKDPYRKNYKYQAGKDAQQINAHGDPLLQQFVYHDGQRLKAIGKVKKIYGNESEEVFTQNINSLTGKTKLKL